MIVLINGGPRIDRFGHSDYVARLISPRSGNIILPGQKWAADNDAFLAWDEIKFRRMLESRKHVPGCLFVSVPDVVSDAKLTRDRFFSWHEQISLMGYPLAFVGQDGIENLDVPWDIFGTWFIGGSTEWKLSQASRDLVRESKKRGKWVHMGRVNSLSRISRAYHWGCDSIDGSGWSKFPDVYAKKHLPFMVSLHHQRTMKGFFG